MTLALDTNVLAYAEGVNGPTERDRASRLVEGLPRSAVVLPIQVLGELYNVLVRKAQRPPAAARAAVIGWRDAFTVAETTDAVLSNAVDLAVDHRLSIWDAVIMSVAAEAGCRLLLSQDLHSGFTWRGVTVVDPFSDAPNSLLARYLRR